MRISDWSSDVCSSDLMDQECGSELRIVSDALWEAVKRQQQMLAERYASVKQAAQSRSVQGLRRPASLLSGLLECGTCGGTYAVVVGDRYGFVGHHRSRSSINNRTIRREALACRAPAGLERKSSL